MTPTQTANRLKLGVGVIILGSLAAHAAPVTWHLQGEFAGPNLAAPVLTQTAAIAPAPVDIGPILTLAPFGSIAAPPEIDIPLGETTLDLTLIGVFLHDDAAQSRAMIDHQGQVGRFGPGDALTDTAQLVQVAADHVVIDVAGTLEILSFPEIGESAARPAVASGPEQLLAAVQAQSAASQAPAAPETTQDYIDMWRDRITANPGEVLTAIGLIPTAEGYVIADEHDSGVGRAGLRSGDLIRSVNGQQVGDVERDRQLYDDVAASGTARIEIVRDGRSILMSFPLQ